MKKEDDEADFQKRYITHIFLSARNGIIDKNYLWLLLNYLPCIVKIDLDTEKVIGMYHIPTKKITDMMWFYQMVNSNDKIYIIPHNDDDVYVFDKLTHDFDRINLNLNAQEKKMDSKFRIACLFNKKIFIVGHAFNELICIDTITGMVSRIDEYKDKLAQNNYENCHTNYSFDIVGNKLIIPLHDEDAIIEIDMCSMKIDIRNIDISNHIIKGFPTVTVDNDKYILTDFNDCRIEVNIFDNSTSVQELNTLISSGKEFTRYIAVFKINNSEYYYAACEAKIFMWKNGYKKNIEFQYPYDNKLSYRYYSKWEVLLECNEKIYFQTEDTGEIFVLDTIKDVIRKLNIEICNPSEIVDSMLTDRFLRKQIVKEDRMFFLTDMLRFLKNR